MLVLAVLHRGWAVAVGKKIWLSGVEFGGVLGAMEQLRSLLLMFLSFELLGSSQI